jgi:hypothetical protein
MGVFSTLAEDILHAIEEDKFLDWLNTNHSNVHESFPWKPREIMPGSSRLEQKLFLMIEVMGLSKSGKSEFFAYLENNPIPHARQILIREPELKIYETKGNGAQEREVKLGERDGMETENILYSLKKALHILEGSIQAFDLLIEDYRKELVGDPIVVVLERGPHDAIAHCAWIGRYAMHKKRLPPGAYKDDSGIQRIPDHQRYVRHDFDLNWLISFVDALALGESIDAVILYGTSLETAIEYRIKQGLAPHGHMTNPFIHPQLDAAFSEWLGSIAPVYLKLEHSMGLKVVDAEKSLDENNREVHGYINTIVGQLEM